VPSVCHFWRAASRLRRASAKLTSTDDDLIAIPPGIRFPLYPRAAILPLLPAKQRLLSPNDWMATDAVIACPDPNCGGRFRISRGELRTYRHSEQAVVGLEGN
jgi:uncharacterized repeat protein (TIGR04076 family)